MHIGEKIKERRLKLGWTQREQKKWAIKTIQL